MAPPAHPLFWNRVYAQCGALVDAYDRCVASKSANCTGEKLRRDECLATKVPAFRQTVAACLPQFELFHVCMTASSPSSSSSINSSKSRSPPATAAQCSTRARDLAHCMRLNHPRDPFVEDMAKGFEAVSFHTESTACA